MRRLGRAIPVAMLAAAVLAACTTPETTEPLKLWSIDFGTGVDAENKITNATRTFAPTSTVYASLSTQGGGRGTVTFEWAAGSTVVSTEKREIVATKPTYFAFHYAHPDGWPKGMNHVRFALDDGEKHVADFQVE